MVNFRVSTQVLTALIASFGSFLYGIALGWSSPSAIKILDTERTFEMTSNQFAWAVSMNSFGAILGCFCTGIIRDRFGSRISIALFTVPSFCGWMALSFARAWWMVILGRLLIGIAAAGYSYNVLIYIGECASKEIRGKLLTFYEITLKCGILFSYALGTFTSLSTTNFICTALVIGYCVAFTCLLPESPLFLMKQHKSEQAKKSLRYLRGRHYKMDEELLSLQNEIAELERTRRPFWQEIKTESTRNAFLILISMFFFFQMCGINAVVFYTTTILIESGIKINPFLATCILGSIQVISVLCATAFVDRYGRRILLILSNLVMMIGLLAVAVYFLVKESIDVSGFEWLPLASLCVYLIGFSFGVGSVTFVLLGEMFSLNAKRLVGPMAQITNYLMSFAIAASFPSLAAQIGIHYIFFIFAGCCLLSILFIVFKLPETKGKSLVEIQALLTKSKN